MTADPRPEPTDPAAADARGGRPILLVGMMGSGKSSVGKRLASMLNLPFYDADDEIVAAAGMTINEIFDRYGEPHFRDGERRVITRLLDQGRCVIATGGGAFAQDDTRQIILDRGIAIWLDVPVDILFERVARRTHRPLLNGRDTRVVLEELMERRRPAYAQAHLRVPADKGPHTRTVDTVMDALKDYLQ